MKNIFIILLTVSLLSGWWTVSHHSTLTPEELSWKLSERYTEIGIRPLDSRYKTNSYKLGEWTWWDKPCGGFVGHDMRKDIKIKMIMKKL
jgi:hypothetical protein